MTLQIYLCSKLTKICVRNIYILYDLYVSCTTIAPEDCLQFILFKCQISPFLHISIEARHWGISDFGTLGATKLTPLRRTRPKAATATAHDIFDLGRVNSKILLLNSNKAEAFELVGYSKCEKFQLPAMVREKSRISGGPNWQAVGKLSKPTYIQAAVPCLSGMAR